MGKPNSPADPVAFDHAAADRVRPAQHLAGRVKISGADHFADARAAHRLAIQRHRRQAVDLKTQFRAQLFQQRHIAAPLVAENKIRADADAVDFPQIARQFADESFAGLFAESFVERNFQQRVRAERFNRAQFLRARKNLRRHAVGRDDGIRMPVKRDDQRQRLVLPRVGNASAG